MESPDPDVSTGGSGQRLLGPLERVPLRQQVYEALEELIIHGRVRPTQHLVEADLATQLGVSRILVREALALLHRDGWIDLRPGRGAFVRQPTPSEMDEIFSVRILLGVESARLAAENGAKHEVEKLREILDAGIEAHRAGNEVELVRLNSLFHSQITEMAGNQALAEIIQSLDKRIRWYFASVVKARAHDSWKEHWEIVDAIAAGEPERAAERMRRHADATKSAYHGLRES